MKDLVLGHFKESETQSPLFSSTVRRGTSQAMKGQASLLPQLLEALAPASDLFLQCVNCLPLGAEN